MNVSPNGVKVNNALVTATDVLADNGVIHVIDTVLMPPKELSDIVDTVSVVLDFYYYYYLIPY